MPPKRPPGPSGSLRLKDVLLWTLAVPALVLALQQQPKDAYPSPSAPVASLDAAANIDQRYDAAADSLRDNIQLSGQRGHRDTYPSQQQNPSAQPKVRTSNHKSALATLSPAESNSAVRAPPASRGSASTAVPSRLPARSLQDWQVEDIILLATVDGSIHARDRRNFAPRWQLESDKPMVETIYHRHNKSYDEQGMEREDPLWVVEPSQDGQLYVYAPQSGFGMQKLPYTVKEMAEIAPYLSEDGPAVSYTAQKTTTLYTIDAATGHIMKMFSSAGSMINNERSCRRVNPLENNVDDDECERIGVLTLGRTEYEIAIMDTHSTERISTIRYFEWTANNRDSDLRAKYTNTFDNKYVYTRHDGTVFRPAGSNDNRPASLHHKFDTPVVRVFDVFRPEEEQAEDASLVILPQPLPPRLADPDDTAEDPYESVFVGYTPSGSWYALSDEKYPDVTHEAPTAKCYGEIHLPTLPMTKRAKKSFVGVHPIATGGLRPGSSMLDAPHYLTLDSPVEEPITEMVSIQPPPQQSVLDSYLPTIRSLLLLLLLVLGGYGAVYGHQSGYFNTLNGKSPSLQTPVEERKDATILPADVPEVDEHVDTPKVRVDEPAEETIFAHSREGSEDTGLAPTQSQAEEEDTFEQLDMNEQAADADTPKKKKATRGRRGGRKQKEKEAAAAEARARRTDVEVPEVAEVISVAASESPQVTGPLQINSLIIHTDKVIGQGSCGTCVFEGAFEGRAVAVKRMLSQYYELASQEVSFLQQSDDHENVIRYYCQQKDDHFLYIAVELCQASLFEVWEAEKAKTNERQQQLRHLKLDIQQDPARVLQQLAKGLHHLHKLRIIHRDIKPQNILVAFPRRYVDTGPRMVISDFGLGKNLPENVSTLIDPTGNAGTSGWKAPELISQPASSESRHSQSNSHVSDNMGNGTTSGVKRAADIFSLGCLFFWILTDGVHPFEDENGWTQLRELNIKRDHKKMDVLERWSDAYEPMQLITNMLAHEPEHRPTALQVLNHPFFWPAEKRLAFLCDVSDHFEREVRGTYEDGWVGDSHHLRILESRAREVVGNGSNFLARLDRMFVDTLGKQRKYSGDRLLDLLRALRNKKNHYEDMPDEVKKRVGPLAGGYLNYWSARFPRLLMACYEVIHTCGVEGNDRFKGYFEKSS